MSDDPKDPAIILFGKTIPTLPGSGEDNSLGAPDLTCKPDSSEKIYGEEKEKEDEDEDDIGGKITETEQKDETHPLSSDECAQPDEMIEMNEDPKATIVENKTSSTRAEEERSGTSVSQEKTLKKPDKLLPCPRCSSMDTKFCYYNNYNVNQPRHFCKKCQRYWTAGGTMRNVPVGAGRRKNKHSTSHYRHITVSETLQSDAPNGPDQHPQRPNGTVLTFSSDAPLCNSMASGLNLAEKMINTCSRNGFHQPEELKIPVPCGGGGNEDGEMSGSSVQASNPNIEESQIGVQEHLMQNLPCSPQMPCFPGAPWPYPWNAAQWNPLVPPPPFCPPGFPVPFYPMAAYWGYTMAGTWNLPWLLQPSSPNHTAQKSGPDSPTLGKHSRDESVLKPIKSMDDGQAKENSSERCLWIPKTLRIDDPGEAAKSSIWATLGIKNDKGASFTGGGLFKAFQSKVDERGHSVGTSPVLQLNPAALSRSLSFHENW